MSAREPEGVDHEVGHRIRIYRIAKKMTQTELANKIGVTFQQLQKYEKSLNRVSAGRLSRIAEALGLPVTTLLGVEPARRSKKAERHVEYRELKLLTRPGAIRLLRAYAQITSDKMQRQIVGVECIANERN